MAEHGISTPPEYIVAAMYHDADAVRKATADLLDLPDPPTAIMFPDDFSAIGGRAEIFARGMSIPDDISICGYDGITLSTIMTPKLTTWEQDTTELGRIAVDKLIEQIEKPLIAIPEQIIVRGRLLESETVQKIG